MTRLERLTGWTSLITPLVLIVLGIPVVLFGEDRIYGLGLIALGTMSQVADELRLIRRRIDSAVIVLPVPACSGTTASDQGETLS